MAEKWKPVPMTWRWLRRTVVSDTLRHCAGGIFRIGLWAALLWVSRGKRAETFLYLFLLAAEVLMIADRCWWMVRVRRQEKFLGVSFEADMAGRLRERRYVYGKWFVSAEPLLVFHRDYIKSVKFRTAWEKVDADPHGGAMVLEGTLIVNAADGRQLWFILRKKQFSAAAALKRWVDTGYASWRGPARKDAEAPE